MELTEEQPSKALAKVFTNLSPSNRPSGTSLREEQPLKRRSHATFEATVLSPNMLPTVSSAVHPSNALLKDVAEAAPSKRPSETETRLLQSLNAVAKVVTLELLANSPEGADTRPEPTNTLDAVVRATRSLKRPAGTVLSEVQFWNRFAMLVTLDKPEKAASETFSNEVQPLNMLEILVHAVHPENTSAPTLRNPEHPSNIPENEVTLDKPLKNSSGTSSNEVQPANALAICVTLGHEANNPEGTDLRLVQPLNMLLNCWILVKPSKSPAGISSNDTQSWKTIVKAALSKTADVAPVLVNSPAGMDLSRLHPLKHALNCVTFLQPSKRSSGIDVIFVLLKALSKVVPEQSGRKLSHAGSVESHTESRAFGKAIKKACGYSRQILT